MPTLISNASFSNSAFQGGTAAYRSCGQLCTSVTSSSATYHTKAFNMPDIFVEYASGDGQTHFVSVKRLALQLFK